MALHKSVIIYRDELDKLAVIGKKRCTKCKAIKILTDEFTKNSRVYGGYANHCSTCQALSWSKRKGRTKDATTIALEHALLREQRQLAINDKRRCVDCRLIFNVTEHFPHRSLKWARFKDSCKGCAHQHELRSKTTKSQQGIRWRQRHRILKWAQRCIVSHQNRGIDVTATPQDIRNLVDENGFGVCYYTGCQVCVGYGASVDMMDSTGKFEVGNICLCTHSCNSTKWTRTVDEFKTYLELNPDIVSRIKTKNDNSLKLYYLKDVPLKTVQEWVEQWQN